MQLTLFKKSKSPFIIILIVIQLSIIAYLATKIYQQKTKVLGTEVLVPIKKESLTFNPDSELEFFYEPKTEDLDTINSWIPYKGTYSINSDSLNERFDYTLEKSDKAFRIVTLGDSFTFGMYVDTENNYSEQLENLLNNALLCKEYDKFEVINLGVGGYDIQYSSERYKIRGQKYGPDLIIWFIKNDDIIQVNEIMLPEEKIISEELRRTGEFDKLVEKGDYYPSWNMALQMLVDKHGEDNLLKLQIRFLEDFRKSHTPPLLIITFPSTNNDYKKGLNQFAVSQSNVFFHDKIPEIFGIKDAAFPNDGHPTILGHELIAKNLFEYLIKENLISCSHFE